MTTGEINLENAPLGTKAPSIEGGAWCKTARGWKWNGPGGHGSTLPRPGGDWNGRLIPPQGTLPGPKHLAAAGKRPAGEKAAAANQQMPRAKALELINAASWSRSYSVSNLDALELVRKVERYYGRTEGAPT